MATATAPKATAQQFVTDLLTLASQGKIKGLAAGNYNTSGNQAFLYKWIARENTAAAFNPLATKQKMPGSVDLPGNSPGDPNKVQQYTDINSGVQATAITLGNGNYQDILNGIASGNASQLDSQGHLSHGLLKWSGGGYNTLSGATAAAPSWNINGINQYPNPDPGVVTPEYIPGVAMSSVPGFLGGSGANLPSWFKGLSGLVKPGLKMFLGLVILLIGVYILTRGEAIAVVTNAAKSGEATAE